MKSKRCREPEAPLPCPPSLQQQTTCDRKWEERHGKNQKLTPLGYKEATCDRKWAEMDHELLIFIMKKYRWYEWGYPVAFTICKSWLSAFLDLLFPPGDVLDLRPLDDHANFRHYHNGYCPLTYYNTYEDKIRQFCYYLKLNLNRRSPNHYSKLILSECILHSETYQKIAQMLPSLRSFVCPDNMSSYRTNFEIRHQRVHFPMQEMWISQFKRSYVYLGSFMFPYWKNLEDAHCHSLMIPDLRNNCKTIRNLTIVGEVTPGPWAPVYRVLEIVKGFPLLERLSFPTRKLTLAGLCMIVDSHKNLSYLDMKHTVCEEARSTELLPYIYDYTSTKDLPQLVARAETFLTWDGKSCPNCTDSYSRVLPYLNLETGWSRYWADANYVLQLSRST